MLVLVLAPLVLVPPLKAYARSGCRLIDLMQRSEPAHAGEPLALRVTMLIGGSIVAASPLYFASPAAGPSDALCSARYSLHPLGCLLLFGALLLRAFIKSRAMSALLAPAVDKRRPTAAAAGKVGCGCAGGYWPFDKRDCLTSALLFAGLVAWLILWLVVEPTSVEAKDGTNALLQFGPVCELRTNGHGRAASLNAQSTPL